MSGVRLVGIRDEDLRIEEVLDAVEDVRAGAVVSFTGAVRSSDGGRDVAGLGYSAHPSAAAVLEQLADEVAARPGVVAVAVLHREGELGLGEVAVVAAVSAEHRGEAFEACALLVDELKARAPIWKHQRFADGTEEWVGSP